MDAQSDEPIVSCELQGGTLSVFSTEVVIDRSSASIHEDKSIPYNEILDVDYSPGLLTGHIQIEQHGLEPGTGGLFSHPVDENTLYFPRSKRSCVRQARDAILERATG